ncbi:hypothetical protein CN451_08225 [Priestia megaterium]|uniref:TniQ family protein n=1 Tax=Priestia megaterium TaxID=1404 RepID=UPI000BF786BF|nr:TniQ family protein [Priestia megaterium]PEX11646.1 hypothetical protein CN451_08225 [Priestia megaterium]
MDIEIIDLDKNIILEFSELYSLKPMKNDIGQYESLTSYICRLAEEHSLSVGVLMNKLVFPLMKVNYLINSSKNGGNRFYDGAKSINCYHANSINCAKTIQLLTLRDDLTNLTLIKIKDIVSTRNLLKDSLSWCPHCLNDFRNSNKVYYPLTWYLKVSKFCLEHEVELVNACPHCSGKLPILHRKSTNGYCLLCTKWLGEMPIYIKKSINAEDKSINNNLEQLLSLDRENTQKVSWALEYIMKEVSQGNIANFARLTNIPKVTMWDWIRGERLPDLNRLLSICYQLNLSIKQLLLEPRNFKKEEMINYNKPVIAISEQRKRRDIDVEKFKKRLMDFLTSRNPISLSQVAKEMGYDRKVLYKHFPEECKKIVERFNRSCNSQAELRQDKISLQVKEAISKLKGEGIYPSRRKVEELLGKPGLLREQRIKQLWKEEVHI